MVINSLRMAQMTSFFHKSEHFLKYTIFIFQIQGKTFLFPDETIFLLGNSKGRKRFTFYKTLSHQHDYIHFQRKSLRPIWDFTERNLEMLNVMIHSTAFPPPTEQYLKNTEPEFCHKRVSFFLIFNFFLHFWDFRDF